MAIKKMAEENMVTKFITDRWHGLHKASDCTAGVLVKPRALVAVMRKLKSSLSM